MKPLFLLLSVFIISILINRILRNTLAVSLSAKVAMCVMLCFTAMGHFLYSKGMSMMLPSFMPFKTEIIYVTGVAEIILGMGLLIQSINQKVAWILIAFFILLLPANIYAALHHVNYQEATFDGDGPEYLWFRIPLQIFFIAWIYLSSLRAENLYFITIPSDKSSS